MSLKGKIGKPRNTIQARAMNYTPTQRLGDLVDVDTSLRQDGSVIIWDEITQTFKVTGNVENPNLNIIGGSF
jgi:hypothetical protein